MARSRLVGLLALVAIVGIVVSLVVVLWRAHSEAVVWEEVKPFETRCKLAVGRASQLIFNAIREGRSIDEAWRVAGGELDKLASSETLSPCPCWRSQWIINPDSPKWTVDQIAADPILAVAAFNHTSDQTPRIVLVTVGGSARIGTVNDIPIWASAVRVETAGSGGK